MRLHMAVGAIAAQWPSPIPMVAPGHRGLAPGELQLFAPLTEDLYIPGSLRLPDIADFPIPPTPDASQSGHPWPPVDLLSTTVVHGGTHGKAAAEDFDAIQINTVDMLGRANLRARLVAEAGIARVNRAIETAHMPELLNAAATAHRLVDFAQTNIQLGSYLGYLEATEATALAEALLRQGIERAADLRTGQCTPARPAKARRTGGPWRMAAAFLLMLAWLMAGALAGLATLSWQDGGLLDELRDLGFSVWAVGLLGFVVFAMFRGIGCGLSGSRRGSRTGILSLRARSSVG